MTTFRARYRFAAGSTSVDSSHCAVSFRATVVGFLVSLILVVFIQPTLLAQEGAKPRAWNTSRGNWQTPHPAVVRIIVDDGNGTSYGSGTLIARSEQVSMVITNWHVIRDAKGEITVAFPDGFRSSARVAKKDRNWDLAALVIWTPKVDAVPIATRAARPGDPLTIAGYGSGQYRMVAGKCTQYVAPGLNFPYEMLELSVEARQGDSGGPILNEQGELAGVLFGAGRGTTSGSYSGRVQQFLDPLLKQLKPVGQLASRPATQPLPFASPRLDSDEDPMPASELENEVAEQAEAEPKEEGNTETEAEAEGVAGQETVDGAPIADLDQEGILPEQVAQLPEEESSVPSEQVSAADAVEQQESETVDGANFRLVPVRSAQAKATSDTLPAFKMVPVSDVPGSGFGNGDGWQRFANGTLFDQIKGLLALVGFFYLATLLVGRRE